MKNVPLLPNNNYFNVLAVEEPNESPSAVPDTSLKTPIKPLRKPKWERRLPEKLKIGAAGIGPNSLYLRVEIESPETQRKQGIRALVDSGATGLFINREYVKSNQIPTKKLSQPIPVYNMDGTANTDGAISEVADLLLRYNGHSERALFSVTGLGRQNLILGHTWLKDHNPEVDWRTGNVKMSQCSPRCCSGCRNEAREERRDAKKEAVSIEACQLSSFPVSAGEMEVEDLPDNELPTSDLPFDLEEGDQVWATGLLPEAHYIQASTTISQWLAEGFAKNVEANPTLPTVTGGRGAGTSVPDYIKIFGQVFSEEGFARLPNRKPWDHAIELPTERV